MKTVAAIAFSFAATNASAHPGHGNWFHHHQDDLIDAAMIAIASLVAVYLVRVMWKVLAK